MDIKNLDYGSCDIYFDESDKSLKNRKREQIASLKEGKWVPSIPIKTYSLKLQKALSEYFNNNPQLDPAEALHDIQRLFSKVKKDQIRNDEWFQGGCITLDLDKEDVEGIITLMSSFLKELEIPFELVASPHISTAYLIGYNRFTDIDDMIKILSNYKFEFKIEHLELFNGATTAKDYLVFTLRAPYTFYKALEYIEKNSETIKFPQGFKSHVSLFSLEKESLTPQKQTQLLELVKNNEATLLKKLVINPKAITFYNNSQLLEIRKRLKKIY